MVPAATPVTTPVPDTTVAAAVLPLLHAPPDGLLLMVMFSPTHTADGPLIVAGNGLTVACAVAIQPVGSM